MPAMHEGAPRPISAPEPRMRMLAKAMTPALASAFLTFACGPKDNPVVANPVDAAPPTGIVEPAPATPPGQPDLVVSPSPIVPGPAESGGTPSTEHKKSLYPRVDSIITIVQNPDQQLIQQYGLLTGSIDANTQLLIEGDKNPPGGTPSRRGLNDLKTAVDQENNKEGQEIIREIVERGILGKSFSGGSGSDLVNLTDEEIQRIDKDNNFARLKLKNRAGQVSVVWKDALTQLVELFNKLKVNK